MREILYLALTAAAFAAGIFLATHDTWVRTSGLLLYWVAGILLILQVISIVKQHEKSDDKPSKSKMNGPSQPVSPPYQPRK
ncbi:MAG: hypothetical protein KKH41_08235 [Candidatus Thermoplasmatota archaeon]|nr:hypothetical protein [Euryarchaeota archaeon]MBU4032201.1 hypothetical protein [Candidatus Thermoplasmatota archaeon]MBU4071817.1 hypothetical protein [Candidatus Thermoplasmatota archaeon]MBU4143946.1 hypothetical protein [Candidatus Thermoplasmatota archaeon]MBU4592553.1 hypothetical protein [Candidatus Thermoplasmatota archaeon]